MNLYIILFYFGRASSVFGAVLVFEMAHWRIVQIFVLTTWARPSPLPALLLSSSSPPLPHNNAAFGFYDAACERGSRDHLGLSRRRCRPHHEPPARRSVGLQVAYRHSSSNGPSRALGVSYSKYMNLYTVAYNYCVSSRMHGNIDASVGLGGRSTSLFYSLFSSCQTTTARLTRSLSSSSWRQLDGL